MVFPPVAGQRRLAVHQFAALEEVAKAIHAVIVEGVGIERRLTMLQHHVATGLRQLVVAVIEGVVAGQAQGVALYHLDMSEGLKRIGLLIEVGTVAVEVRPHMAKVHAAVQHLSVAIAILVVVQVVGMYQVDTFVLHHRLLARSTLARRLHGKHHAQRHQT